MTQPLRKSVLDSWHRSVTWSVDSGILGADYLEDFPRDMRLLEAAEAVLAPIVRRFDALGIAFILADASGRIIQRWTSERRLIKELETVNASVGHTYAEDVVGTNAIGTVIELGQTLRLDAQEHYAEAFHGFSCIGVPLRDPVTRRLRGVLDVTARADHESQLITLVAEQVAEKIVMHLQEGADSHERVLFQHFTRERHRASGIAAIGPRTLIADPRAARLLSDLSSTELWHFAGNVLGSTEPQQRSFTGSDGQSLDARAVTVADGDEPVGVLVRLQETLPPVSLDQGRKTPAGSSYACEHLVGRSAGFLASVARARKVFEEGPVAIRGERGSGRQALAADLYHHSGMRDVRFLNGETSFGGASGDWMKTLDVPRDTISGALVFRNADLVPRQALEDVARFLGSMVSSGWRIVLTVGPDADPGAEVLTGICAELVDIPDLESREGDIELLTNAFALPKRVSSETHLLLRRMVWARNIAQLRNVVETLCRSTEGMLITPDCFPPELLENATRRRLSRLERLELRAILQAMAECGGNRQEAADLLGVSRSTLYRKLRDAGINTDHSAI